MNNLDEAFLFSKGFKVLHHPEAFNMMTPATFLFAPRNECFVISSLLEIASPALYLGTELDQFFEQLMPYTPKYVFDKCYDHRTVTRF